MKLRVGERDLPPSDKSIVVGESIGTDFGSVPGVRIVNWMGRGLLARDLGIHHDGVAAGCNVVGIYSPVRIRRVMVGLGNDVAVFDDIALVVFGSGG